MLRKYFCCICYSDKRKKLRQQQQQAKKIEIAQQQKEEVDSREEAVTKIQCLIRRFLAKSRLHKKYEDAIQMANDYWLAEILMAKYEKERRRRELEITKMVILKYILKNLCSFSCLFFVLKNLVCTVLCWRRNQYFNVVHSSK